MRCPPRSVRAPARRPRPAARLVRQRFDGLLDVGIERMNLEERLPLGRGGGKVAAVPGELAAGQQIEDEVLLLGGRLHRQILWRAHRERQRQLLAQPSAPIRRWRRGLCRRNERSEERRRQQRGAPHRPALPAPHRHQLYTKDEVKTLLATVGAPASSRLSRYSTFKRIASQRS